MISHPNSRIGILEGNPIHEDMIEASQIVDVDFMVNVILNSKNEIVKVVAGDPVEAYMDGVKF
jgi:nickel-dependent lactate racemase